MESEHLKIINQCQGGDLNAFRPLVENYQNFAFNLAFKILANEEDAKDVAQEAFIRVWKNIKKYDLKNKFTTWLYKIVVNLCLDHLKMNKRRKMQINDEEEKKMQRNLKNGEDIEQDIIHREMTSIIHKLIDKLTPKQRIVFVLFFIQEQSIEDIKAITGMAKGSIKSNLYYARKNMQLLVEKNNYDYQL